MFKRQADSNLTGGQTAQRFTYEQQTDAIH